MTTTIKDLFQFKMVNLKYLTIFQLRPETYNNNNPFTLRVKTKK
jgi:hypothetical protein